MRIDSSGALLVGTTDKTIYNDAADEYGFVVEPTGEMQLSADNRALVYLNRQNGHGDILQFRKDGAEVGNIGTSSDGSLVIASTNTGVGFGSTSIAPTNGSLAFADNQKDLGAASIRWKDLYLSGGVVFGSTGGSVTSKTLDDYEEGTCTLTMENTATNCTVSNGNTFTGYYTKVGRQVTVHGYSSAKAITNAGTGGAKITGLPFGSLSGPYGIVSFAHTTAFTNDAHNGYVETNNSSQFYPTVPGSTDTAGWETGTIYFMFGLTYYTA